MKLSLPWALRNSTLRLILLLAAFAGVAVGLTIPFLTLTARDRGVSLAAIGVMAASYLVAQMFLQLPMGALSDRVGRAWPVTLGLSVEAVATAGFAFAGSAWVFILLRVIQGVGVAMLFPALRALISDVTPLDRRGQAYAGFRAAFSAGLLFGPLIGGVVAESIGVDTLFVTACLVEVVVAVGNMIFLRRDGGPKRPSEQGERVPFSVLLTRPLIGAFILSFAGQFQMGLFDGIWSIYLADLGASDLQIGISFATYSIAFLVLAPFGGRLADSGKRWRRLLVGNLLLGAVILSYGIIPWVVVILLVGCIEGALSTVTQPSLDAYLATVGDRRVMGRVQGMFASIGMTGAAISALLGSILYGVGRIMPFLAGGVVLWLLTLGAVRLIRETEERGARPAMPGPNLSPTVPQLPGVEPEPALAGGAARDAQEQIV